MNIISNATSLMSNVLSARAERIASDPDSQEELVPKPHIELNAADPEDRVEISRRAEEMQKLEAMRKDAPRIDWENRTYKGKKIPDTYHKEPTPEMLSGEQPYSVSIAVVSGERAYVEQALPERERAIQQDMEYLQNMEAGIERLKQMAQHYMDVHSSPDPKAQAILEFQVSDAEADRQRFLEQMVIGYDQLGYDLQYAHDYMKEVSFGEFDLAALLEKYFGS